MLLSTRASVTLHFSTSWVNEATTLSESCGIQSAIILQLPLVAKVATAQQKVSALQEETT